MRRARGTFSTGLVALALAGAGCGDNAKPGRELVRLEVKGALARNLHLDELWTIKRNGEGSRTGPDPGFDRAFTVSEAQLERLTTALDGLDLDELKERFGADGSDRVTTEITYAGETATLGDRLSAVNDGEGEDQADRLFDVQMMISRLSAPRALDRIESSSDRNLEKLKAIVERNRTCDHVRELARDLPDQSPRELRAFVRDWNLPPDERPCRLTGP